MRTMLKLHGCCRAGGLTLSDWGAFWLACVGGFGALPLSAGSAMRALLKLHGRSRAGGLKLSDWGAFSLACIGGRLCFVGAFGRWLPLPFGWLVR